METRKKYDSTQPFYFSISDDSQIPSVFAPESFIIHVKLRVWSFRGDQFPTGKRNVGIAPATVTVIQWMLIVDGLLYGFTKRLNNQNIHFQ